MAKKYIGYGDFFCWNCGDRIEKGKRKCPNCNVFYSHKRKYGDVEALGSGGVGWSQNGRHPSIRRYARRYVKAVLVWLIGLSIVVPAILLAIDDISFDKEGKVILSIIVGIFWLFGLGFLFINQGRSKPSWDGEVISKDILEKSDSDRDSIHSLVIRKNNGKIIKFSQRGARGFFDYIEIGDKVRYHGYKYMHYLEKYDKSKDTVIPCNACGEVCDIRQNYCARCGTILIK